MSAMQILSAQPWVDRLGLCLVHFLWQGGAIALVYAAARKWCTRAPNGRYLLACLALAAMAMAPLATWALLSPDTAVPAGAFAQQLAAARVEPTRLVASSFPVFSSSAVPGQFLPWVVAIWLFGAAAFSLRLLLLCVAAEGLRHRMVRPAPAEWQQVLDRLGQRLSISRRVRLLVSGRIDVPGAMGWLRPIVLIPAGALTGMPAAQIEALLLHELAHIRRHDYLIHVLQSAVEAMLFFHPAVWWVSGHMRGERELCCDDAVVSVTGDATMYARTLAEFDAARAMILAANGGSLPARIARLLGYSSIAGRPGSTRSAALIALVIGGCAVLAQSAGRPQFEAASIKPSGSQGIQYVRPLPGRLTADASLPIFMQYAFGVQRFQLIGGPDRVMSMRYEIDATAGSNATPARMFQMLQSLLENRFQLKTHGETREMPVYTLAAADSGLKLAAPKAGACVDSPGDAPVEWAGGRMAIPGETPPAKGLCGSASVRLGPEGARLQGGSIAMPELASRLALLLGRSVIDKTGYGQRFDLHLDFVPDEMTPAMPPPPPGAPVAGLSISQALRQVGLRLESGRGPVEVIVIDHAELPSAN